MTKSGWLFVTTAGIATAIAARADGPADRFVASIDARADVPAAAKQMIHEKWDKCQDCDPEEFLTQGLAVFSRDFRDGLDAYDADDNAKCVEAMRKAVSDADPFVSVNAASYEIKALVAMDQTIEALERIEKLQSDGDSRLAAHSFFAPEMAFLRGFCLLTDLRYDDAENALKTFMEKFGDAPARLSLPAKQMLLELENRDPGKLNDVVDLMGYSGRRLKNADGGEVVQTRQKKIVDLLEDMIKQAEEQEKKSQCDKSGGAGSGGSQSQGGQSPSSPMQKSMLPGGGASEGELRAVRRANPGEAWGAVAPGERERILQAIRESFPSRYRQLVEQYYEELAKKP
ncbi:MAG: hypothetical protein HY287_11490 [Planctomycetes bacterium]|nr:hypothetical protein [Planctomycetota bacterium]MBI3834943.1 hypothetical protein [Planctomycetota bacterium]